MWYDWDNSSYNTQHSKIYFITSKMYFQSAYDQPVPLAIVVFVWRELYPWTKYTHRLIFQCNIGKIWLFYLIQIKRIVHRERKTPKNYACKLWRMHGKVISYLSCHQLDFFYTSPLEPSKYFFKCILLKHKNPVFLFGAMCFRIWNP